VVKNKKLARTKSMANGTEGLEQIKQLLRKIGKETLEAVVQSRGSGAAKKYTDVFASKLAIALEVQMRNPVVVLTDFETHITIEGDMKIADKPFPIAVVIYRDSSGKIVKPRAMEEIDGTVPLDHEDFQTIQTEKLTENILLVLDVSTRTSTPHIPNNARSTLVARAKRSGAKLYGIINFGYYIDIWFPKLHTMIDPNRLTSRPAAMNQIESDPLKASSVNQNLPEPPQNNGEEQPAQKKDDFYEISALDPEDVSID
jgi:hypothetical protein